MPRPISEIYALVRQFVTDPERNASHWRDLAEPRRPGLQFYLEDFVRGVQDEEPIDPVITPCHLQLRDESFGLALENYYRDRSLVQVDLARLTKNAAGLVSSALAAAFAVRVAQLKATGSMQSTSEESRLDDWVNKSSEDLAGRPFICVPAKPAAIVENSTDPAWILDNAFARWGSLRVNPVCTQALFWALSWLNRTTMLESGRRLRLPVAAADARTGSGSLSYLDLIRLGESPVADLCEHPGGALLPLGNDLLNGIERAWRSSAPQSAVWHLRNVEVPQDGDSLSGAAAVGFRKLARGERYISSYLIVARLGENDRLLPAGLQKDKLIASRAHGIAKAILGRKEGGDLTLSDLDRQELFHACIDVLGASNIDEACQLTQGFGESGIGRLPEKLLGRYSPGRELQVLHGVRRWLAQDPKGNTCLVKLWPLDEEDRVRRTLWDRELRILYRISSSPTAEQSLMVLKDAGVDRRNGCFVMVLEAEGYTTLAECLSRRNDYLWLTPDGQSQPGPRRELWQALLRLAQGVYLLHKQNLVHWNVLPENVFFNETQFDSWRLGGFEWSARFGGDVPGSEPPGSWHVPPEYGEQEERTIRLEDDWYAFGMLAARCFLRLEALGNHPPAELNRLVFSHLGEDQFPLQPTEAEFLRDLIHTNRVDRLRFGPDVFRRLHFILEALKAATPDRAESGKALVLRFNFRNQDLCAACQEAGFTAKSLRPITEHGKDVKKWVDGRYNPEDIDHVRQLRQWLNENFQTRSIHAGQGERRDQYLLVGRRLHLLLGPSADPIRALRANWGEAFAVTAYQLTAARGHRDLQEIPLQIIQLNEPSPRDTRSWEPLLPMRSIAPSITRNLKQFWDFLRCTNQIELILRRTEVFPYRMLPAASKDRVFDCVRIVFDEAAVDPDLERFVRSEGDFIEYFQRERESGKRGWNQVILSEEGHLRHPILDEDAWEITEINDDQRYLDLKRRKSSRRPPPTSVGFIRGINFKGQVRLFERRKQAIDRLGEHTYLLKALSATEWVAIDTQQTGLPRPLDSSVVDDSKLAVMEDILRTRPIYALLGPPGTGKSTLVAHLLREILTDDPVAQILVTAQAHGAVDVLLEKVVKEAFGDLPAGERPITVRLGLEDYSEDAPGPGQVQNKVGLLDATLESRAKSFLQEQILPALHSLPDPHPLQQRWRKLAEGLMAGAVTGNSADFNEFVELVKRGAHIIFSTTSSGDLEDLAKGDQFFDWVVVEEAGKVHGFDLALPLQAGHRWILLGDYKQLSPYRDDDFRDAIRDLDVVTSLLRDLSGPDARLVDYDWLRSWPEHPAKDEFRDYALGWVRSFEQIYKNCQYSRNGAFTTTRPIGALAGMLSMQYRMHPAIGQLISASFYRNQIVSMTDNSLLHEFSEPVWLKGKALVWLNMPWCGENEDTACFAESRSPRYTNDREVDAVFEFLRGLRFTAVRALPQKVAVLSPYNRQTQKLNQRFRKGDLTLCEGLAFRESLSSRRAQESRLAHTVDSFQGNQADIVVVSLTRNNLAKALNDPTRNRKEPHGLGFLDRTERLNVMLSRAERLLVLVGSWEFFERQLKGVSLESDPDTTNLWSWKKLMEEFRELEQEGVAYRRDWGASVWL